MYIMLTLMIDPFLRSGPPLFMEINSTEGEQLAGAVRWMFFSEKGSTFRWKIVKKNRLTSTWQVEDPFQPPFFSSDSAPNRPYRKVIWSHSAAAVVLKLRVTERVSLDLRDIAGHVNVRFSVSLFPVSGCIEGSGARRKIINWSWLVSLWSEKTWGRNKGNDRRVR